MNIKNSILSYIIKKRTYRIDKFIKNASATQEKVLKDLIKKGRFSMFGKEHFFNEIKSYKDFTKQIPIRTYEDLFPYIEKMRYGIDNVLWPEKIKWFAKSSGTTNDKSKFIPVSKESINKCYSNGGKDMLSLYCSNYPKTQLFTGKGVILAGNIQNNYMRNYIDGDISAILMKNLPYLVSLNKTPDLETNLLKDWESKLKKMSEIIKNQNITSITGIPSWILILLERVLNETKYKSIQEVWPNLELYIHGGVNLSPYKNKFDNLLGAKKNINYLEVYNASEGFFAIQNCPKSNDLLLMLDYGIFYEFICRKTLSRNKGAINELSSVSLDDVKTGIEYAIIISTNSGLWRYLIGDTIKFTSIHPYKIQLVGRIKNFINTFGEELIRENAEQAIKQACLLTFSDVNEYTAYPILLEEGIGVHEWLIEFNKRPNNIDSFSTILDEELKKLNSDYKAKRSNDLILQKPLIKELNRGTFYNWLAKKDKLGRQNKVPRLSNDNIIANQIIKCHKFSTSLKGCL